MRRFDRRHSIWDVTDGDPETQASFGQVSEQCSESSKSLRKRTAFSDPLDPVRQRGVELIRQIAAGEEAALADLYELFAPMLFGLALRMMKDRKEAEDVLQEGFLYIWRKAVAYKPELSGPFSWTVRIVRNKAIDHLRSLRREQRFFERATVDFGHFSDVDERSAEEPVFGEQRAIVRAALAQIPAEQRQAIELAFFDGLTHEEIAAQLDTPLGTIKARIRRGLIRLRNSIIEAQ
jgi:RNA polymerase sigma-70 factor, ECF subfamily